MENEKIFKLFRFDRLLFIIIMAFFILLIFNIFITFGFNLKLSPQQDFFCTLFILYGTIIYWLKRVSRKSGINFKKIMGEYSAEQSGSILILGFILTIFSAGILDFILQISPRFLPQFTELLTKLLTRDVLQKDLLFFTLNRLIIVLIAPIVEEILFRGILLHKWGIKYGVKKAVFLSSLIFGVFHLNTAGSFVFSIVASLIYLKNKKLILAILMHMIYNLIYALGLYLERVNINLSQILLLKFLPHFYSTLYTISLIIFVGFIIYKNWANINNNLPYYSCF